MAKIGRHGIIVGAMLATGCSAHLPQYPEESRSTTVIDNCTYTTYWYPSKGDTINVEIFPARPFEDMDCAGVHYGASMQERDRYKAMAIEVAKTNGCKSPTVADLSQPTGFFVRVKAEVKITCAAAAADQ